jgi:hypothetical protein
MFLDKIFVLNKLLNLFVFYKKKFFLLVEMVQNKLRKKYTLKNKFRIKLLN